MTEAFDCVTGPKSYRPERTGSRRFDADQPRAPWNSGNSVGSIFR
jgi:hypothetical protein